VEIIFIIAGVLGLAGGGIYGLDAKGWNAVFRRIPQIVRANVEAKVTASQLHLSKLDSEFKEDWERQFEGRKPTTKELAEMQKRFAPKHEIIERKYININYDGRCPSWKCSCGESGYKRDRYGDHSVRKLEKMARRAGDRHVKLNNKMERRLSITGGKFEF